jgi:GntR family transcriptional regulator, transcriptional repressor for pyruvate dehydrogenase complex
MYRPIQSSRLYEQIVYQIEQRIVAGELHVGEQLPSERELADQFGVSRTAVREAIKALREKGLVEIYVGRGTFISNEKPDLVRQSLDLLLKVDSTKGFLNLVELREVMEPEIAALAAIRINDEDFIALQDCLAKMETAIGNVEEFVEADLDFHLALAEATQNPVIPALLDPIIELMREQRTLVTVQNGVAQHGQNNHKIILEAIRRRDPDAAREAMRHHLEQVRKDFELLPGNIEEGKNSNH